MISAALACFARIQNFLLSESYKDPRLPLIGNILSEDASPETSSTVRERSSIELQNFGKEPTPSGGAPLVVISDASFGWTGAELPILKNISTSIRKSHFTFMIGKVGSGKSTLMKAILGETRLFTGSIYAGTHKIAYVGQEPWIQNLTIGQNILGNLSYDRDWYNKVVHACGLEPDIFELPKKDATMAGSAGISLSGGQKQRLALARAVYSRKELVLLDDVFAGQDAATEEHIYQSLFAEKGIFREMGTTVVCITSTSTSATDIKANCVAVLTHLPVHRLVNADHIIALGENGHILHQGSFEQLQSDTDYLRGLKINYNRSADAHDGPNPSTTEKTADSHFTNSNRETTSSYQVLGELDTYGYYFGSVPSWYTLLFITFIIVYGGSYKMTELLLSFWTAHSNAEQAINNFYLGLYGMLSGLALLGVTCGAYFFLISMVPLSSEVLHARLLQTVIRAPLSFFSTTDVGVTTNRFSQDMSIVDTELPFALIDLAINLTVLVMGAVLMCVFSGYFAVTIAPMILFCWRELTYLVYPTRNTHFNVDC
jgi:ABC-type multidrug transport system fused ATPase/permease subunit